MLVQCWRRRSNINASCFPVNTKCYANVLCLLGIAAAQQTRYIEPGLGYCWVDVADGGPTLTQHWVNVSCLLGGLVSLEAYCWPRLQADTDPMSIKCWASVASIHSSIHSVLVSTSFCSTCMLAV